MDLSSHVGASFGRPGQDRVEESALGVFAVATAARPDQDGSVAVRLALDSVRTHVDMHADVLRRFERHPSDELRARLLAVLEDAFVRAAQEVFGLAQRLGDLRVDLDVVLVVGADAFVAHAGGGCVLLARQGMEHRLTSAQRMDEEGPLPTAVAPPAIGVEPLGLQGHPSVEILCIQARAGDVISLGPADTTTESQLSVHVGSGAFTADDRARLAVLNGVALFAHCSDPELRAIARAMRPRGFDVGGVVVEQGCAGTELFVVVEGCVEVVKDGVTMATLGPGAHFGEMALLDHPERSATVRAASEVELLALDRRAFFGLLKQDPALAVKVLWNLSLRLSAALRETSAQLASAVP
ncbi:MAG: cyclic nucleotide-binding domain-containing protein [Myxococcales bacterium]|nr:cyclic nucleotide-binding domain-containing protein [Myxococcales bacterium]